MFCKHKWTILSETTTESLAEKAAKHNLTPRAGTVNPYAFSKKLIQIVSCSKCGKLKKFVEDI